jgi:hypothetical protein
MTVAMAAVSVMAPEHAAWSAGQATTTVSVPFLDVLGENLVTTRGTGGVGGGEPGLVEGEVAVVVEEDGGLLDALATVTK